MSRTRLLLLFVALGLPSCQSAPKAPPASAVPVPEQLRPYDGALLILRQRGDERSVTLKPGEPLQGSCDLAVRVRRVAFEGGVARFSLETLGTPRVGDKRGRCRRLEPGLQLALTGFAPGPVTEAVTKRIDEVLQSPEAYLRAKGVAYDRAAGEAPADVASQLPDAGESERRLARAVVAWPRPLLTIDAAYHEPSKRAGHERLVGFETTVGSDGRPHKSQVRASLDRAHEQTFLDALSLWRFEPARRAEGPLGARVRLEGVLRVF
jgi:hypothetical protein